MGQGQQKTVINPNTPQNPTNPNSQKFLTYINDALRNCSNGGYVNKDSFVQVLAVLENQGFKRLRDTPIADRLFNILDKGKSGRIAEQEFSKTIGEIINDRNSALMYTFRIYDLDGDNKVSRKQFLQLIQDSWRAAYRILAQKCDGIQYGKLSLRDLQNYATSKVSVLNEHSSKLFSKLDSTSQGYIQFQAFREFVSSSGYNDITVSLDGAKVVVPLNLTTLLAN